MFDGNNTHSLDQRLARADLIVWVRVPRWLALWGVVKRMTRNYGTVRDHMPEGCPEQLPDREFLDYIWNFDRRTAPRLLQKIAQHGANVPMVELRSRRDAAALVSGNRAD